MHKLFPPMMDRPDKGIFFVSVMYWVFCFMLIPFVVLIMLIGWGNNLTAITWFDICFYGFNFLVIFGVYRRYLLDAFLNVQLYRKSFFGTVGICVVLMMLLFFGYLKLAFSSENFYFFSALPMTETSVLADSAVVVAGNPLFGTLCVTLLTPVTVSCLFYAAAFAPIAVDYRPWIAYIAVAVVLLIPRLFIGWWRGGMDYQVQLYLMQLPFHLLACWSYQKTDTVWAPIISLSITNLLSSLVVLGLLKAEYIFIH